MSKQRRRQRRETQLLQSESRWLQKARFALQKAQDARSKLAETRGKEPEPIPLSIGRKTVSLDQVRSAFVGRIEHLMERIRERRQAQF